MNDRAYTYMSLFNYEGTYTHKAFVSSVEGFTISIGEVGTIPDIKYTVFDYEGSFGNDFLSGEWR